MSIRASVWKRVGIGICLLVTGAVDGELRAQETVSAPMEKAIAEVRLLAPEPSAEGAWLVQVETVLNGSVPGSVVAVQGLPRELVARGEAGERLRLVLAPGIGGTYRVLSAHVSPEAVPALADPEPPPLAVSPEAGGSATPEAGLAPKAAPAPSFEQQVVERVNQERWNAGQLPPLKQVDELHASAETHSANMATRDFFAHCDLDTGTSPTNRAVAAGYSASVAENIAAGYADPAAVMAGWMASTGHRNNILSNGSYEIGVGYVLQSGDQATVRFDLDRNCLADPNPNNGPYLRYWTQNFGRRSNVYPVVIDREAVSTTSTTVDLYVYGAGWAQQMRFSNDGSTWSAWETYDPNKSWTLPGGAGTKTVYAQVRNGFTLQASDTIYLDVACSADQNVNVPNETVTGSASWAACDTITAVSGFTVGSGGDVTFQAGRRIVLGDGFAVLDGGSFAAVIQSPP